jgi:hypothetical protein
MAVSPLAILTPVGNFRSGAAFASQIALTSVEAIHLHEGCHILGRNVFLPEKVPHVSRQHLKLDVRPGEIEITVVRSGLHVIQWNVTLCNHSSGATAGTVEVGLLDRRVAQLTQSSILEQAHRGPTSYKCRHLEKRHVTVRASVATWHIPQELLASEFLLEELSSPGACIMPPGISWLSCTAGDNSLYWWCLTGWPESCCCHKPGLPHPATEPRGECAAQGGLHIRFSAWKPQVPSDVYKDRRAQSEARRSRKAH